MSDLPLTEARWAKLVEIRPTNLKGRKVLHHSIAYLVLNNDPEAVNTGTASGRPGRRCERPREPAPAVDGWAIGKGYDLFRPDTGSCCPARRFRDQHIHAVGEDCRL
jgi:hypothetical protein